MKTVLITGVNGFVGNHLVKELTDHNIKVVGIGGLIGSKDKPFNVKTYVVLDLNKPTQVKKINFHDVDAVIHLAGLAAVGPSFDEPMNYITTNVGIEVNLFEAAIQQKARPKFLIISSGALYNPTALLPLDEQSEVLPNSPYAVSKLGQELTANYYQTRGFDCIIGRPFNHIGPGQNSGFIVPDLAQQLVEVERCIRKEVMVGNLDSKRDYTDVRDIVRAYRLLLENGRAGEIYNVCSGKAISGQDILSGLMQLSKVSPEIKLEPTKARPSDAPIIYGSYNKLHKDTGWKPEIALTKTFSDVLSDWRKRI